MDQTQDEQRQARGRRKRHDALLDPLKLYIHITDKSLEEKL
jgi:hypothetical protein